MPQLNTAWLDATVMRMVSRANISSHLAYDLRDVLSHALLSYFLGNIFDGLGPQCDELRTSAPEVSASPNGEYLESPPLLIFIPSIYSTTCWSTVATYVEKGGTGLPVGERPFVWHTKFKVDGYPRYFTVEQIRGWCALPTTLERQSSDPRAPGWDDYSARYHYTMVSPRSGRPFAWTPRPSPAAAPGETVPLPAQLRDFADILSETSAATPEVMRATIGQWADYSPPPQPPQTAAECAQSARSATGHQYVVDFETEAGRVYMRRGFEPPTAPSMSAPEPTPPEDNNVPF